MANRQSENEAKINLSDLTKIPAKEFEQQFRDWMERDDVARSLQAKLRTDLISNFNKTALGKQILAHTTTTTASGYGGGGATHRLTLSPLTLALNTLVAEFLYAENCHFALSVFCTEVPFRNTLPDFESMRHFRFTDGEIVEIFAAVASGSAALPAAQPLLAKDIMRHYAEDGGGRISLLLAIVKVLLDRRSQRSDTATPVQPPKPPATASATVAPPPAAAEGGVHGSSQRNDDEFKADVYNTNFRYLNKYLIILAKKVNEMTQQFQSLQQQQRNASLPQRRGAHAPKSTGTRRFENLNRSLERITENLKQVSHAKRRSKHVVAIVSAIEALAQQFAKCAANFENVSSGLGSAAARRGSTSGGRAKAPGVEKQTETADLGRPEAKTYKDWVHEMRHTANGQKFLDRIELALQKALNNQREQLNAVTELKLRHQKELLKIRYRHPKLANKASSAAALRITESIEQQLRQIEVKHSELLQKIHTTAETEAPREPPRTDVTSQEAAVDSAKGGQASVSALQGMAQPPTNPTLKDAMNTQMQLQRMVKNMAERERTVDHIVYDAKLRIQELESESNQLEQSFLNYLERQRLQKEATQMAATKVWHSYERQREKMLQRSCDAPRSRSNSNDRRSPAEELEGAPRTQSPERADQEPPPNCIGTPPPKSIGTPPPECRNAIREAKHNFFERRRKQLEAVQHDFNMGDLSFNLDAVLLPSGADDWRSALSPELPRSPLARKRPTQLLFPPSLMHLDDGLSERSMLADGCTKAPPPTSPTAGGYRSSVDAAALNHFPYQPRPIEPARVLYSPSPAQAPQPQATTAAPLYHPADAPALAQTERQRGNQPVVGKAIDAERSKLSAMTSEPQGTATVLQQSMAKMQKLFGQAATQQITADTDEDSSAGDGTTEQRRESLTAAHHKMKAHKKGDATTTATAVSGAHTQPRPKQQQFSVALPVRGPKATNETVADASAGTAAARLTASASILSAMTAATTSLAVSSSSPSSSIASAEKLLLFKAQPGEAATINDAPLADTESSSISREFALPLRAENLCAPQKTTPIDEAMAVGAVPAAADPLEMGEFTESAIGVELTTIHETLRGAAAAVSTASSPTASSSELQFSIGGGAGRQRDSDSGSDFWQ